MERKPFSLQLTDPNTKPESRSVSKMDTDSFDFEFPTVISSSAVPNDVVFWGKVITRETQPVGKNQSPFLLRSESSSCRPNRAAGPVRSVSTGENRWRRSDSNSSSRKHRNGLFGMVKFPLQMDLSDIKTRQERRKQPPRLPLPMSAVEDEGGSFSGGESCWDLVRPVRRRSQLMKALFGCIPIV
ncbi:uncharacterized protein LOC133288195 [Gastrolobium bilobum]|uniref:uncharacterized protein LOC133288195 n=1 Tax=Gastrolobium bilobum TaxID=150636 RepID=UPI002AAF2572|nr:uncharacterized protein LOC133288195 [Gastrolobium bilobum]